MGSGNWIIDNLNSALNTWNSKMTEIWNLLIQGPETFKGGGAWTVIQSVNGALKGIGLGLLVLFFAMGVIKTCSGFSDMKRPEQIFKMFIRFALAEAAVEYGLDLLLGMFSIGLGMVQTVMKSSGLIQTNGTALPQEIIDQINQVDFRKIGDDKVIEYKVSGEKLEVIDIPTGYTHNIENIGDTDMVTVMWANEPFDPDKPDTYFEEV